MKKLLLPSLLLTLNLILFSSISGLAQKDLFKGIFDKEVPAFHPTVLASGENGVINLVYHFTHSKLNTLEASIWIKDQGSNLMAEGTKNMVMGLQEIGNRQQDTVIISGLINNHFYTIGIDYRAPNSLSKKFNSAVLQEGYRYYYTGPQTPPPPVMEESQVTMKSGNTPSQTSPSSFSEPAFDSQENTYKQENPCRTPGLSVGIDKNGYCGASNRPAVWVRCLNCSGADWKFSVEVRQDNGYWEPIRTDGERQSAFGGGTRKEPLCMLKPGDYHARVLAWGDNCQAPVIMNIPDKIYIGAPESTSAEGYQPFTARGVEEENLPATCEVEGSAFLDGNVIRGKLLLDMHSPCATSNVYAEVTYVHPGYRDVTVEPVNLVGGDQADFLIYLDHKDLSRGIHTIQVATYINSITTDSPALKGSFWIKAEMQQEEADLSYLDQNTTANTGSMATKGGTIGVEEYESSIGDCDPAMIKQQAGEVHVKASDPNCPQIQELEMVFESDNHNRPLYISWLSPRCCQEEGCAYTIWAGNNPDQLRMLVKGNKPGAQIIEVLQGLRFDDQYVEVEVNTGNGSRKAAYVIGDGPKYGIDEIFAYRDQLDAPVSDPVVGTVDRPMEPKAGAPAPQGTMIMQETMVAQQGSAQVGGELAARAGFDAPFAKPTHPVEKFKPCKYQRDVSIIGDQPIHHGDEITIRYDFVDKDYQYTLYQLPPGASEWVVAHGTKDLQSQPNFTFEANTLNNGKYVILAVKKGKNWGCLSSDLSKAFQLNINN